MKQIDVNYAYDFFEEKELIIPAFAPTSAYGEYPFVMQMRTLLNSLK